VRLRAELGLAASDVLVLYVGRLAWEKNLDALLSAFAQVRQQFENEHGPKLKLVFVGDGPLLNDLRHRAGPDVVLPGPKSGEDLARWYASADIFAFPSRSETFGNVILEAQASGLPVLAFRYPATEERIQHGRDGLLLTDDGELTVALAALCTNPSARRSLQVAARETARRQAWEPIFDHLEAEYATLVAAAQARQRRCRQPRLARPVWQAA
jgi:glycosyltransferase involved in cell wall biosynthesis